MNDKNCFWITQPHLKPNEYGVYHFRKVFTLLTVPSTFIVHVSADQRYRLFINGSPICSGPAYSDLLNWNYETIDIATFLQNGQNIIAAVVWNMGTQIPTAQLTIKTAFYLRGNSEAEGQVNTNSSWKVLKDKAYSPCCLDASEKLDAYMAIGPGDELNGVMYPWNWELNTDHDQTWKTAIQIDLSKDPDPESNKTWNLSSRTIPLFIEETLRFPIIRRATMPIEEDFLKGKVPLTIQPHQSVSILFDQSQYTVAYPELIVSNGKGSTIQLIYAESLFDTQHKKGNRNEIEQKEILGTYDLFYTDGAANRKFRPLWFRAYRYLQLNITTSTHPLTLNDIYSQTTGYPLEMNASFSSNDISLKKIWEVGWHTAKMCAGEVYYDTPYYEQMQYVGDSRIQALISLYISGDDRLMRKTLLNFHHSRNENGLTQSRYPTNRPQFIPAFSLFWVSMVYDYWMHRADDVFIMQFLPTIIGIMNWFHDRIDQEHQMLGKLEHWNFTDWADTFDELGNAKGAETGNCAITSLQYACTLVQAAGIFAYFNLGHQANEYRLRAKTISQGTFSCCYHAKKGLIADTPDQKDYSQHAGIWLVLSGFLQKRQAKSILKKLLKDETIGQVTFFYRFYLVQALNKAGLADLYYAELRPWREMLKLGLTTFAEKPEPTRSDCHAWSASPSYDFLATICGIMPASPGFKKVLIKPAMGQLTEVKATMPHPNGLISVELKRIGKSGINAIISLPPNLSGKFDWNGKIRNLYSGKQSISIKQ